MTDASDSIEKPCLVRAGRDFSVLYRNRHLYSKYDPERAVRNAAENLTLRENTLILCFSPVLCVGLAELAAKLPAHCFILLIEVDPALFDFFCPYYNDSFRRNLAVGCLRPNDIAAFAAKLEYRNGVDSFGKQIPPPGTFRRVVRFDMSGGVQFYSAQYAAIQQTADSVISQFWRNRITLVNLGRLFSRNLFRNLVRLPTAEPLPLQQITRPILVVGAGPSADKTLDALDAATRLHGTDIASAFFVLAVDTALPALTARGIVPGMVVQVEAQFAIAEAYRTLGALQKKAACFGRAGNNPIQFALDVVSRPLPSLAAETKADIRVGYFFSAYTDAAFLDTLRDCGILSERTLPVIPPMGSVGLSAVHLAARFRKNEGVPIFVTGLDFAYTAGKTHCKGAPAHTRMFAAAGRLTPVGNPAGAFREGSFAAAGKNGGMLRSDPALSGYCASFSAIFSGMGELFDIGEIGLSLGIPCRTVADAVRCARNVAHKPQNESAATGENAARNSRTENTALRAQIDDYYRAEESALNEIKAILSENEGENESTESETASELKQTARKIKIRALLKNREYLYAHFPDGYAVSDELLTNISFLKRVRAEIDFFLKDIRLVQ